jgi:hypothetical protein
VDPRELFVEAAHQVFVRAHRSSRRRRNSRAGSALKAATAPSPRRLTTASISRRWTIARSVVGLLWMGKSHPRA